jgi:hypothetical protein
MQIIPCPLSLCMVSNVILGNTFASLSINSVMKNLRVGPNIKRIKPNRSETLRYAQGDIMNTFNTNPCLSTGG